MGLGMALHDLLGLGQNIAPGDQPSAPMPTGPKPIGKGQMIAGIIADALAAASGGTPQFAPMMERRRAQEDARAEWGLRQKAEDDQWMRRQEWQRTHPEPSAMERNLATWQGWTPQQRDAYSAMQQANDNEFVTMSLPNGQFYAGPRSGIVAALSGAAPQRPQVGAVVPDPRKAGGPVPQAPATFR